MEKYTTNLHAELTALRARLRDMELAPTAETKHEAEQLKIAIVQLEAKLCEQGE